MGSKEYFLRAPATPSEWEDYHRIRRTALFALYHPTVVYDPNDPDERESGRFPRVFLRGDTVIGTIRIDLIDAERAAFRIIAIDHQFQRQGHGSILLELAEDFARREGRRKIVLHGNPPNLGFYLRNGYFETQWEDDEAVGDTVDLAKDL